MRNGRILAFAAALVAVVSPAFGQQAADQNSNRAPYIIPEAERDAPLLLHPGDRIVATLDDKVRIATLATAPPLDSSKVPSPPRNLEKETFGEAHGATMTAQAGTVIFSLYVTPEETKLAFENNDGRHLVYIAALVVGKIETSNFRLTTICSTPPGKIGIEGWPGPVDAVVIIRVIEPDAASEICVDPRKDVTHPRFYTMQDQ
jgi:hypothetical protein